MVAYFDLYIPCFLGPVTKKMSTFNVSFYIRSSCFWSTIWLPKIVAMDFEIALISAGNPEFTESSVIG
ncbi:hypothetical protein HZS_5750 [Henneguya salminicola]|nr:hypothetical protein HZS_5750 [Henneguya salminicola]